ncbi:MAG: hypothetical protein ACRENE_26975 [Polyangiaceae bacterium]
MTCEPCSGRTTGCRRWRKVVTRPRKAAWPRASCARCCRPRSRARLLGFSLEKLEESLRVPVVEATPRGAAVPGESPDVL